MRRATGKVLLCVTSLLCACAQAQNVTVSGRVKVIDNRRSSDSLRADNVVVWLTPAAGEPIPRLVPKQPLALTQPPKRFEPHLLVVPVGAVGQFPNRDPFFHNVFSLFEGKRFDLGLYESGTTRFVEFDKAGISFIFCNIHAQMSAVVIALATPYYAISDARGELSIPGVPPGRYQVQVFHPAVTTDELRAMNRQITVGQGTTSIGSFTLSESDVTLAHKNKYGRDYDPPQPESPAYAHP